jgi:hypothetical protein
MWVQSGNSVYPSITGTCLLVKGGGETPQAAKTNIALWFLSRVLDSLVLQQAWVNTIQLSVVMSVLDRGSFTNM